MNALQTLPAAAMNTLPKPGLADGRPLEVLTCQLGQVSYGISLCCVQEIRSYEQPTQIANTPAFVKGIVDLRGVIVPIIDLRLSFGLPEASYGGLTVTVILNVADRVIGVVVDSVSDVVALRPTHIKPAPDFNEVVDASFIAGIGTPEGADPQHMLVLLDIEKLMSSAAMGLVRQSLQ